MNDASKRLDVWAHRVAGLHYINERLGGFAPGKARPPGNPFAGSREFKSFPEFYEKASLADPGPYSRAQHLECVGPITYKGQQQLTNDINTFKAAMSGVAGSGAETGAGCCNNRTANMAAAIVENPAIDCHKRTLPPELS